MTNFTLITGGTGFIGSSLVETLVKNGRKVRCLVRKTSNISLLKKLPVEIIYGDLTDRGSLDNAVKGVDVVFHLAAQVRPHKTFMRSAELLKKYAQVNLSGTDNLTQACLEGNISKFIFYSSIAAVGPGINLNEYSHCLPITDYGRSKLSAEELILKLVKERDFPAIVIRPGQIYGPRCLAMVGLFKLINKGLFLTVGNGDNEVSFCYVNDLIRGTLLAEEKGGIGQVYFIAGNAYRFRDFARAIAESLGRELNKTQIPRKLALAVSILKEKLENILDLKICPFQMDICKNGLTAFSSPCVVSIAKANNELEFRPEIDLKEGIGLTVEWYKENNLL